MAALNKKELKTDSCKEVVCGILRALQHCVSQLKLREDSVSFNINWDNLQNLSDVRPAFLCSAVRQHISDMQPFLDQLQSLVNEESEQNAGLATTEVENTSERMTSQESKAHANIGKVMPEPCPKGVLVQSGGLSDPAVVQIKAKKAEIDRRILAFMERKQAEINENNVREFCNVIDCNQENSCARTDAVFTPYPGFKSHIKVSRVVNTYGPQTRNDGTTGSNSRVNHLQRDCGNQQVEERLQNIECHLRLQTGGPVPKDIYQRIKKLEDKILELEGISPEYFNSLDVSKKRKKPNTSESYSLVELDQKINALKQSLLQKSRNRATSETDEMTT
ncbi:MAP3K12-binding inhibitory protein 1 isoform 2-T2 [Rhinophrynus dorsalis]